MIKRPRLGSDPLSWIKDTKKKKGKENKTVSQKTVKPARQQAGETVNKKSKKVTYYVKPGLIKKLKLLGVEKERDLSSLVSEAIEGLIKKYRQ